jgi:NADH:ubiquinone oxidoreductase subunit 6 (subunit J)
VSFDAPTIVQIILGAIALLSAMTVVLVREIMRMAIGLGVFLLSVAGLFLLYGASFLATSEVFVYVGGVLVLMLFAIMLVQRSDSGRAVLVSRHDIGSASVALGLFVMLTVALQGVSNRFTGSAPESSMQELSEVLMGGRLVQYEIAGLLLLVALVAVIVIAGGDER